MPRKDKKAKTGKLPRIRPIPFGERSGPEPYNASELVAIADSRFLFCDNNVGNALFELRLAADGSMAGPLVRRPIHGIQPGEVDDLEAMTQVKAAGRQYGIAIPSLSLKRRKGSHKKKSERGKVSPARGCLLRISIGRDDRLEGKVLPGFREWLVENAPELKKAARLLPDDGGLNVEGLAFDRDKQALLLGLRTPLGKGRPLILRVGLKKIGGPWQLSNLKMLPAVRLAVEDEEQGIRTIGSDRVRGVWLIVVGNSTSDSESPFVLYEWDGNERGKVRRVRGVRFHKRMKVEGVTRGTIGGRGAVVFVDDAGGYQVLWDDDPRLA